jgi:hypothetical protein
MVVVKSRRLIIVNERAAFTSELHMQVKLLHNYDFLDIYYNLEDAKHIC